MCQQPFQKLCRCTFLQQSYEEYTVVIPMLQMKRGRRGSVTCWDRENHALSPTNTLHCMSQAHRQCDWMKDLETGDHPGSGRWTQCHRKGPCKRGERITVRGDVTLKARMRGTVRNWQVLRYCRAHQGRRFEPRNAGSGRNLARGKRDSFLEASEESSPHHHLDFRTSKFPNCKIINVCYFMWPSLWSFVT